VVLVCIGLLGLEANGALVAARRGAVNANAPRKLGKFNVFAQVVS